MENLRKYKVKFFSITNKLIIFKNYTISYFFSRFGNNLQQIAIGLLYTNQNKGNFYFHNHKYIENFSIINNKFSSFFSVFKKHYRFFYFSENKDFPEFKLNVDYVYKNIENVFKSQIKPRIKFLQDIDISNETLVIHIRSGDIFYLPINSYHQNPINYYLDIISKFDDILIVTSSEMNNPACNELLKLKKVRIQTSSLENDFNTLSNATNLCTSGVGTFPIAAAMVSDKLRNFYYSNLYSREHLNPEMILNPNVEHHKYKIHDEYSEKYSNSTDFKKLILDKSIKISKAQTL
tara:strand:+ start:15545 stop:16420 length:876 start_codon:yes stop_codon:yes gene_type:complete